MADYQLRARIPQEMADRLFGIAKDLQEKTEAADVTVSSVTRRAIDSYLNALDKESITIETQRLTSEEVREIANLLDLDAEKKKTLPEESRRFLLALRIGLEEIGFSKHKKENP